MYIFSKPYRESETESRTVSKNPSELLALVENEQCKDDVADFEIGDTVIVHTRIVEGSKERIQKFEGVVIRRNKRRQPTATFTVRKISYNVGVEKTFLLYSPRVEKIEVVSKAKVRRSRLYYLCDLKGRAARLKKRAANQ